MTFLVAPRRICPAGGAAAALLLAAAVAGCGRTSAPAEAAPPPAPKPPPAAGYLTPPALTGARRAGGTLRIEGSAPGGAAVTLASPASPPLTVRAGRDGRWSLALPAPAKPALFALFTRAGDRQVRAEGAVLVLPEPASPAMLVRAGFAALPLDQGVAQPVISALDFDAGGGAAVAGLARPMARVRLSIDGAAAGLGQADEVGRFAVIAANRTLAAGVRRLEVETDDGRAAATVIVSRPALAPGEAYRAMREDHAWRIDWSPAGGGVQTTVVFDRGVAAGARP